jgi:hypothetical protein
MAASYASQKLNATAGALKAGQQPQSIQGLINSGSTAPNAAAQNAYDRQRMAAMSQRYDPVVKGAAPNPKGAMPGAAPGDYVRTALGYNVNRMDNLGVTDANRIVDGFNNLKQFKDVSYDPDGVQKIKDGLGYTPVGIRTNNPGNILNSKWQSEVPGYAGPVKSPNGLTYASYTDPRWGLAAQNELLGRYYDGGRTTINEVVDRYAPVDENNSAAANRSYKDHLSASTGWDPNQALSREQVQSLGPYKTSFENGGALFAGGPFGGTPSPTSLASTPKSPLQSAMDSWNPPQSSAIPAPTSTGMLPNTARDPAAARMAGLQQAPSQNMQQPTAPPAGLPGFTPQSGFAPQGLPSNFRGTAGVASTGNVPGWGYSPSADYSAPSAGTSLASSTPESYSPQAGPGDEVYSENPMQGSQNPMQEGENPQVKRDRQQKYASRGATIGGIVAGPLGTVVGGTLGWQMGKTPPRQRQAIASNPQALTANVKSINDMVEERGGKGNPQMQVTEAGFRDVLTNPAKVTKEPEKYTTLEQMLAALAQGVDPETGKPIT